MDIFTIISISPELGSVLATTIDVAINSANPVTEGPETTATACYRQGSFSFGRCSMTEIANDFGRRSTSFSWLWLNVLFAMMFLRRDIHRFWKVTTFLFGLPGTALIAGFLWLMGRKTSSGSTEQVR